MKLLPEHEELVRRMQTEMKAIAELVFLSTQPMGASAAAEDEDDEETVDEHEP
jgi:hypothetical protein